jgi:hypothetical protein
VITDLHFSMDIVTTSLALALNDAARQLAAY